jgi:YggT family protein
MRVVACDLLFVYSIILLVRVLSSWFRIPPYGPVHQAFGVIYAITEPVLKPVRGILPPVRMGMMAMDLSPIIVFVIISVLRASIC